ncbi:SurA N-terminal domain-containing protein [Marinimicrobium alkaliphilum]|uniref:SurA N-terminal domain-containing protein n=1 Tax=Marinimicrobium alkaliphilum TaxID=2202654 RepID=UPI000DB9EC9B|nr:SurA N-terminal domain-containing protein [Marinimicrobium alkaliphilum]
MLQNLRENSKGLVAGLLIGFLVIIFALSGSEALFMGGSSGEGVEVSVDGERISEIDINRAVNMQRQQLRNMYGDSVPSEFLSDERLREPVVESLIQRKAMAVAARSAGMSVSDDQVNQIILAEPMFRGEDDSFDSQRFQQILRAQGFTPSTYRAALREDLLIEQLVAGIAGSSFITEAELARAVALNYQTRDFSYVTIAGDEVRASLEISDAELEAFYQGSPEVFTQPERVAVDYIDLSVENIAATMDVPERQIREQYEQEAANYAGAAERNAAHILLDDGDRALADELYQRLAQGEDFAALAAEYSVDSGSRNQGGELGYTAGDMFPDAFESALADLSVGDVSEPVSTEAGIHLIKLLDERGGEAPSFEEQRERIARQLRRARAEGEFAVLLERLRDLAYVAEDLAEVADELGLEVGNTGLFPRSGGQGVAAQRQVIDAAFSDVVLEYGEASDAIELGPDRVVVVKKTDFQDSYVQSLDDVREQALEMLRDERVREQVASRGEALKQALASGQSLAQAAEEAGLEVRTVSGVTRDAGEPGRALLRHAFALPRPSATPSVAGQHLNGGNYAVIELTAVEDGRMEEREPEEIESLRARLSSQVGSSDYSSFQTALRERVEISR